MSRRSTRIANRNVKKELESNVTPDSLRVATKKKRLNPKEETKDLTFDNVLQYGKHANDDAIQVKKEKNHFSVNIDHFTSTSSLEKTEHQLPASKITKEGKYIGAHVSISGGLHLAVERASEIGAKSFAMFLRSQRQWNAKPLDPKNAELFKIACKEFDFSPEFILPHGIYLMNCGSSDTETLSKSRQVLVDELTRCEMLGLTLYNFHPGSTCGKISVEKCLDLIAESINLAHEKTKYVVTVLENMSCQGNTVGGKFEELRGIIDRVQIKSRVGVCLDTCHAFAAGYDVSTRDGFERMMSDFESIIGIEYLKGVHLNDSKGELGCHLDRHENIGKGKIGKKGFHLLMNDERFKGIPMVLETPCQNDNTYAKEISLLYSMQE